MLILGANSLVSPYLAERLQRENVDVLLASRHSPRSALGAWQFCDLAAAPDWSWLIEPFDLISLAPIWLLPPHLEALCERGLRYLIACSSSSVVAKSESLHPAERQVARRLLEAEMALEEGCRRMGVPLLLLRPTLIYDGRSDVNVTAMARFIRRFGFFPLCGVGAGLRQPLHAEDLAVALLRAWRSRATGTHLLGGPETLPYRAMAGRVFEGLGRGALFLPLPAGPVRLAMRLGMPGSGMLGRQEQDQAFELGAPARIWLAGARRFQPDVQDGQSPRSYSGSGLGGEPKNGGKNAS